MSESMRVVLEIGPKGKRWRRWRQTGPASRAERSPETPRSNDYSPTFHATRRSRTLPGCRDEFARITADVVEDPGTGSTDFWGISFAFSSNDRQVMSRDALERELGADAGVLGILRRRSWARVGRVAEGSAWRRS